VSLPETDGNTEEFPTHGTQEDRVPIKGPGHLEKSQQSARNSPYEYQPRPA
jgi:hypothetical protein